MNWAFAVSIIEALVRFFPSAVKAVQGIIESTTSTEAEKAEAIEKLKAQRPADEKHAASYVPRDV